MKFVKRPVAIFSLSFFVLFCVVVNFNLSSAAPLFAAVMAFVLFLILSFALKDRFRVAARYASLVLAGVVFALAFALLIFKPQTEKYFFLTDGEHTVTGSVTGVMYETENHNCYILECNGADGAEASLNVAFRTGQTYEIGDTVKAKCTFEPVAGSDFVSAEHYYYSKGMTLYADEKYSVRTGETSSFKIFFAKLNLKMYDVLREHLGDDAASLAGAVVLGNRSGITDKASSDLSRLSISHLIAISGMHVSLIWGALLFILRRLRIGRRIAFPILIGAMIFYMFLSGFSPSVVRAATIASAAALVALFGFGHDSVTSLSVCGAAMVLADPYVAYSVAMHLSFAAFIGCISGISVVRKLTPAGKKTASFPLRVGLYIFRTFVFTLSIVMTSLPVTMIYFGSVSLLAPLSNLIFIPLFSLVLYGGWLVLIFSPVPFISDALAFVAGKISSGVLWTVDKSASVKGATVSLKYPFSPYVALALSVLVIVIALSRKKKTLFAALSAIALCVAFYGAGAAVFESTRHDATVIRAGNTYGEEICVVSGGKTLICDFSNGASSPFRSAESALEGERITNVDAYMITKCTARQIAAVKRAYETERIGTVYIVTKNADADAYREIAEYLDSNGIEMIEVAGSGDTFEFGNTEILFSVNPVIPSKSDSAAAMKITCGDESVAYLEPGLSELHPSAISDVGQVDSVILGSNGSNSKKSYVSPRDFGDCRIVAFSDGEDLSGFTHKSVYDIYSTVVLNIDQ